MGKNSPEQIVRLLEFFLSTLREAEATQDASADPRFLFYDVPHLITLLSDMLTGARDRERDGAEATAAARRMRMTKVSSVPVALVATSVAWWSDAPPRPAVCEVGQVWRDVDGEVTLDAVEGHHGVGFSTDGTKRYVDPDERWATGLEPGLRWTFVRGPRSHPPSA